VDVSSCEIHDAVIAGCDPASDEHRNGGAPMRSRRSSLGLVAGLAVLGVWAGRADADEARRPSMTPVAQLGPRPFYLIGEMEPGPLRQKLELCSNRAFFVKSDFSIGHRGAALQFPEHTKESYVAAARMGAGILECDVTFTEDRQLVCRHAQCDLHTTTNILATPLAAQCSQPFSPAEFDPVTGARTRAASARCCTSDITLEEFKTLCGKMDASNPDARTVAEFLGGTLDWRTELYTTCGTLLSHAESIELFESLGRKFTPELKAPEVPMPFQGSYTQEDYAQQLIDEYEAAGVPARDVFAQSFNLGDVRYWISRAPRFGKQAVFLDGRYERPPFDPSDPASLSPTMQELAAQGVEIIAPPTWVLLALDSSGKIVPSAYARAAKAAGLDLITWTLERSGRLIEDMKNGTGGTFYYQSTLGAIEGDGDIFTTLDVLAKRVGILGIFSDWPATVTFYANCTGLR
jgi:glycerophosphoryl diester phosphodiesterase